MRRAARSYLAAQGLMEGGACLIIHFAPGASRRIRISLIVQRAKSGVELISPMAATSSQRSMESDRRSGKSKALPIQLEKSRRVD